MELTRQQFTLGRLESDRIEEATRQRYLVYRARAARTRAAREAVYHFKVAGASLTVFIQCLVKALRLLWKALHG